MTKEEEIQNKREQLDFENQVPRNHVIQALLSAAFRELQHDTGPSNKEYRESYNLLAAKFKKILK